MTPLLILAAVLLVIFLVLMLSVSVTVEYRNNVTVHASVLGIPLWRHPKKKKKIRLSDYTPQKIAKREAREKRKQLRRYKRKKKKQEKQTPKSGSAPQKKRDLPETLRLIRGIVAVILKKCAKHGRIRTARIHVTVATEDAAKTAILFGAVNQAVASLLELLDNSGKWKRKRSSEVSVKADFTAKKCSADVSISFSLRVWQILNVLFHAAWRLVKQRAKRKKQNQQKITQA